ncbi:MAG: sigma-54 dependent transcriptional regulator [Gammaproteobacteria bacterium]|nr:sigma-54 dependent transcriptional regulator [Gammaproteobacteria bacterium]
MSTPHILVVDDEADIRDLVQEILAEEGYDVSVAANASDAREARHARSPDLVLLDIWMPDTDGISLLREWSTDTAARCPVVMMSGHGTVETAVEATRLGAVDFIEKPLSMAKLLRTVEIALESTEAQHEHKPDRWLIPPLLEPIGKSRVMQSLREQIKRVAATDSAVLLTGEPGTGRETLARYLHALSQRGNQPFINVVLASLNDQNVQQELFGVEKNGELKEGFLERAQNGTLFLNELDDMTSATQRLLLSVLENKHFKRVGGSQNIPLRCRILSSAYPDIGSRVEAGRLRRDLFNHLDVIQIKVPPLREYREDVPDLLRYYVDVLVDHENLSYRRFSVAAQNRLRNYPWPGNIRELKNIVQRFLLLDGNDEIGLEETESVLRQESVSENEPLVKQDLLALPLREAREHFERAYLEQQLQLCNGRVGKLAERVGMERTHLYRKLRSLGIEIGQQSAAQDEAEA